MDLVWIMKGRWSARTSIGSRRIRIATRWLVVPYSDRLARADRRIARLQAWLTPAPADRDTPRARLEEQYLATLTEDRAPEPAWMLVMGVGFALFLGTAFWAANHGWDDDDRPRLHALVKAAAVLLFGLLLFVAGLARA